MLSLNSLSNKLGQAAGPVIGGYLMGIAGAAAVFAVKVVSHVIMILALWPVPKRAVLEPKSHSHRQT